LIRRLFTYARPVKRKVSWLVLFTVIRSAQLPALTWIVGLTSPVRSRARHRAARVAVAGYGLLAVLTDGLFHFRQRYALEIGETVVNGLRQEIFDRMQRMPMSSSTA